MRRHSYIKFLSFLFFTKIIFPSFLYGAAGTESALFLNIPVGARAAALGGAYTALASDAYAPTWNPAGLAFLPNTQLAGQHLSYLDSMHYEQVSFALPFTQHRGIGFSAQYLGSGDVTGRDKFGNLTGSFSNHYGAYTAAYGHGFGDSFSLGISARMIEAELSDVSAQAYAFDIGTLYKVNSKITLGAAIAQAGTQLKFLNESEPLPLEARFGAAFEPTKQWVMSAETAYHPETHIAVGRAGVEWKPLNLVAIRAGYKTDAIHELGGMAGFSTGIGVDIWGQEIAYAWVPFGDLGDSQYFSMVLRFGGDKSGRTNLIQLPKNKVHMAQNHPPYPSYIYEPNDAQALQLLVDSNPELSQEIKHP